MKCRYYDIQYLFTLWIFPSCRRFYLFYSTDYHVESACQARSLYSVSSEIIIVRRRRALSTSKLTSHRPRRNQLALSQANCVYDGSYRATACLDVGIGSTRLFSSMVLPGPTTFGLVTSSFQKASLGSQDAINDMVALSRGLSRLRNGSQNGGTLLWPPWDLPYRR